jgi:predicted amidophosphoribosyltransferase
MLSVYLQMPEFACDICGKQVSSKHSLMTHKKLHSGQYNYTCPVCFKGFTSISMLRGHMSWHTGVKEFKCPVCSKEFRYKHEVKGHLRSKHGTWWRNMCTDVTKTTADCTMCLAWTVPVWDICFFIIVYIQIYTLIYD